jgi:hypothetical protein
MINLIELGFTVTEDTREPKLPKYYGSLVSSVTVNHHYINISLDAY